MIARFRIPIRPYLFLQPGLDYPVKEIAEDGYRIKIYPPQQTSTDISKVFVTPSASREELAQSLIPDDPQTPSSTVAINNIPAVHVHLLTIDFIKDQFDRRRVLEVQADPPLKLVFAIANRIIVGLRTLSRSHQLEPLTEASTSWRVDYLDDTGQELPDTDGLYRYCVMRSYGRQQITALTPLLWERVCSLPSGFAQYTWDALLLDAEALLPAIGPAIAVANAALETFIPWALEQLQRELVAGTDAAVADGTLDALGDAAKQITDAYNSLWQYVFTRPDSRQEPSITDQLDHFIIMLTRRSLKKEEPALWEAFQHLRSARNNFIHEGKLFIGKNQNVKLTSEKATDLIAKASVIVNWVETLLPEAVRRPLAAEPVNFTFGKNFRVPLP